MVLNVRNTVAAAMSLVVTMVALAAIYVLLEAHLVAVLQIIVYAGAIVVLFLFVVMLLNLRSDESPGAARRRAGCAARRRSLAELLRCSGWCPPARRAGAGRGLRRLPARRHRALHRLRAAGRDDLAAAAGAIVGAVVLAKRKID